MSGTKTSTRYQISGRLSKPFFPGLKYELQTPAKQRRKSNARSDVKWARVSRNVCFMLQMIINPPSPIDQAYRPASGFNIMPQAPLQTAHCWTFANADILNFTGSLFSNPFSISVPFLRISSSFIVSCVRSCSDSLSRDIFLEIQPCISALMAARRSSGFSL